MSLHTFFENFGLLADTPNAITKLRELILQLAVQGKLVDTGLMDPSLLEQVGSEKHDGLIRLGIRKHPETAAIQRGEFCYSFPASWCAVNLADLVFSCPTSYGEDPQPHLATAGVVKVGNIDNKGFFKGQFSQRGFPPDEFDSLAAGNGDLMVVKSSGSAENVHSGKTALCRDEHAGNIVGSNFVMRLRRFGDAVHPEYLWRVLSSRYSRAWVERTVQTMTYPNLKWSDFARLPVPLPPVEEQQRIVTKVDGLMLVCDELEARLQARRESRVRLNNATLAPLNNAASLAPEELEQACVRLADNFVALYDSAETVNKLRSTILQLGVQGKLIAQDLNDESASGLLKRITEEKERLTKERIIRKENLLPLIQPRPFGDELPVNWVKVRLGDVVNCLDFRRKPINKEERQLRKGNIPYYGANGRVGWIDDHLFDEDLVLVVEDETFIGRTLPFSYKITGKSWVNNHAHVLQPTSGIDVDFLNFSLAHYPFIELTSGTTGRKKLNKSTLLSVAFRLPPLEEQKRIVAKVNQLMTLCDELEAKLRQAEADSEKLMNAAVQHVLASINEASTGTLAGASA